MIEERPHHVDAAINITEHLLALLSGIIRM